MLDNPCKAPDWPPERAAKPSGAYDTESTVWLFPRTRILAARAVFPTAVFLAPAFVFAGTFFGADFFVSFALGFTFLPATLRDFACFFLVFFLAAIGAVYHRPTISGAWANKRAGWKGEERFIPPNARDGAEVSRRRPTGSSRKRHAGWRRPRRSEAGRKSRPASLEMTVGKAGSEVRNGAGATRKRRPNSRQESG